MTESRSFRGQFPTPLIGYLVLLCVAAAVLSSFGWSLRHRLLEQFAVLWTVSDPIASADAVVILGGGVERRSKFAADLYQRGLVKRILISDVVDSSHAIVGGHYSDTTISRDLLRKSGVPDNAVETFGMANQNTRNEAAALADWSVENSATSFIVPTEFLFARRVRWIFNREFSGRAARVAVVSFETDYNHKNWWKTAVGQQAFKTEMLKFVYYYVRY